MPGKVYSRGIHRGPANNPSSCAKSKTRKRIVLPKTGARFRRMQAFLKDDGFWFSPIITPGRKAGPRWSSDAWGRFLRRASPSRQSRNVGGHAEIPGERADPTRCHLCLPQARSTLPNVDHASSTLEAAGTAARDKLLRLRKLGLFLSLNDCRVTVTSQFLKLIGAASSPEEAVEALSSCRVEIDQMARTAFREAADTVVANGAGGNGATVVLILGC